MGTGCVGGLVERILAHILSKSKSKMFRGMPVTGRKACPPNPEEEKSHISSSLSNNHLAEKTEGRVNNRMDILPGQSPCCSQAPTRTRSNRKKEGTRPSLEPGAMQRDVQIQGTEGTGGSTPTWGSECLCHQAAAVSVPHMAGALPPKRGWGRMVRAWASDSFGEPELGGQ